MRRRLLGEASRRLRHALARESSCATTARVALQAISACYVAGSRAHSWLYDAGLLTRRRLPAPTVSVGNFTAGGTGKTPLVQHISAILEDAGCIPLVVARGYGDDEAYQMRHRFEYATSEVVCGADRYDAVDRHRRLRAESQEPPDVFVLDDGLQHWPVARDLDVVVVNAYDPWGHDTLLRERPRDGLARANLIVLHNCAPGALPREHIQHIRQELVNTASREKFVAEFAAAADPQSSMNRPACPPVVETYATPRALLCDSKSEFFVSTHGNKPDDADIYWKDSETGATMHSVDDMTLALRGRTVVAVSGIGCPDAFADMIKHQLGAACVDTQVTSFPDHHVITDDDVSVVERRVAELSAASFADNLEGCAQQPVIVVTTEKDFFRCANHPDSSFIARLQPLVISMDVAFCHAHEESVLADMLLGVVNESSSSSSSLSAKTSTTHSSPKLHVAVGHPRTNKSLHNQPHAVRAFSSGATVMKHTDRTYGTAEPSEFPFRHVPVLAEEVARVWMPPARFLSATSSPPQPCLMVDATAGGGGHSKALLDATVEHSNVRVLCIDRDAKALQVCSQRLQDASDRVFFAHGKFSELPTMLERPDISKFLGGGSVSGPGQACAGFVGGVLADLGVSTYQLENPERGFSCMSEREGPLDMRMSYRPTADGDAHHDDDSVSAADLVNNLSEDQLTWIFEEYGGISHKDALEAARGIFDARPLINTRQLANAISGRSVNLGGRNRGVKNVSSRRRADGQMQRYFQALRIATNGELEELDALLSLVPPRLVDGGVFAVISFHSLEDARVKNTFRDLGKQSKERERERQRKRRVDEKVARKGNAEERGRREGVLEEDVFTLISRRAIKASAEEIERNKPSRSARLRVLQKGRLTSKKGKEEKANKGAWNKKKKEKKEKSGKKREATKG